MSVMQGRNESVDWLRGLLAAAIMVYHLTAWEIEQPDASSLLGRLGIYGVSMFFILSGLSIALVYHRFIVDMATAGRYFVRRIFRIWPLLWLAVIVVTAARALQGTNPDWTQVLLNLTTLFGFVSPSNYINTGAWSIGNEMVYYVLTPAFIAVYKRSKHAGNLLTGGAAAIGLVFSHVLLSAQTPLANQWDTYVNPLNNLFLYCSGIALYYNVDHLRPSKMLCATVLAIGMMIFLWYPVDGDQIRTVTGWNRIVFCGAAISVVFAFYKNTSNPGRLFTSLLTQLGLATYGVYLLHPIVWNASSLVFRRLHVPTASAAVIGSTVLCTFALAWLCYRCYELPFIKWGKKLTSRLPSQLQESANPGRTNQLGAEATTSSRAAE